MLRVHMDPLPTIHARVTAPLDRSGFSAQLLIEYSTVQKTKKQKNPQTKHSWACYIIHSGTLIQPFFFSLAIVVVDKYKSEC